MEWIEIGQREKIVLGLARTKRINNFNVLLKES